MVPSAGVNVIVVPLIVAPVAFEEAAIAVTEFTPAIIEVVVAFVILRAHEHDGPEVAKMLRDHVAKEIGAIAKPRQILIVSELPKTRSGKIMRRLLRVLAKGEEITQDISTLENPAILEQLKQAI